MESDRIDLARLSSWVYGVAVGEHEAFWDDLVDIWDGKVLSAQELELAVQAAKRANSKSALLFILGNALCKTDAQGIAFQRVAENLLSNPTCGELATFKRIVLEMQWQITPPLREAVRRFIEVERPFLKSAWLKLILKPILKLCKIPDSNHLQT